MFPCDIDHRKWVMDRIQIHPSQIAEAKARGLRWEARVEFRGSNANNSSGKSAKFWSIETPLVDDGNWIVVRWGRIGTTGQSQRKPYHEALNKMQEKLGEGYRPNTAVQNLIGQGGTQPAASPQRPVVKAVLPEPYCRIARITLGKASEVFAALDEDNLLVMNLSRSGVTKIFDMAPHLRDASPSIII